MEKESSLTKIGSTVNINLKRINENITTDLRNQLLKYPYGKVVGYKITDGVGLGLIIELSNGEKFWFFEKEININSSEANANNFPLSTANIKSHRFNYSKNINEVINPIKFIKWLKISLNDVVRNKF